MTVDLSNFNSSFGTGQVFNVLGQFVPTKASAFLRGVGDVPVGKFKLKENDPVLIDIPNFINFTQAENNIFFDNISHTGWTGSGFMEMRRPVKNTAISNQVYVSSLATGTGSGTLSSPYSLTQAFVFTFNPGDRIVILADGDYSISSVINIKGSGVAGNPIEVFGANKNGVIDGTRPKFNSSVSFFVNTFSIIGDNVTVENLHIDMASASVSFAIGKGSGGGSGSTNLFFDNLLIENSLHVGINFGISGSTTHSVTNCIIINCNDAIVANSAETLTIENCIIEGDGSSTAIGITTPGPNSTIKNTIISNTNDGITIADTDGIEIINCTFSKINDNAINASLTPVDTTVKNCIFDDIGNGTGTGFIFFKSGISYAVDITFCLANNVDGFVENQIVDSAAWLNTSGNLFAVPEFLSITFGDDTFFRPDTSSPVIEMASLGGDMGAVQSGFIDSNTLPVLEYPISIEETGLVFVYVRFWSLNDNQKIGYELKINDITVDSIQSEPVSGSWTWLKTEVAIPRIGNNTISIHPQVSANVLMDLMYLSFEEALSLSTIHEGIIDTPYITIHGRVFEVNDDFIPDRGLFIYDAINNVNDVIIDDWYNFSLSPMINRGESFPAKYAFIIFSSSDTSTNYIIWDSSEDIDDPYLPSPSIRADTAPGVWDVDFSKKNSLRIWSFRDALDSTGCKILTRPADKKIFTVDEFDIPEFKPELVNVKIVPGFFGSNSIELDLPDRLITVIMDESGSMSWNDQSDIRFSMAKRLVSRVESTYPGDVRYNLLAFGGSFIKSDFIGIVEEDTQDLGNIKNVESAVFADADNNFAGVRVVRKTGSFPQSAIDGDIVLDSFTDISFNENLLEGTEYFFKVFTFDQNNNFSNGKPISAISRIRQIPEGLSAFNNDIITGTGMTLDSTHEVLLHFDDINFRKTNSFDDPIRKKIFDFTSNNIHMNYLGNLEPNWLGGSSTPIGYGAVGFSGQSGDIWTSPNRTWTKSNKLTVSAWFRMARPNDGQSFVLYSIFRTQSPSVLHEISINDLGEVKFTGDLGQTVITWATTFDGLFDEWTHLVLTFDRDETVAANISSLYLNGSLQSDPIIVSKSTSTDELERSLNLGGRTNGSEMQGAIAEFSIHNEIKNQPFALDEFLKGNSANRLDDNGDRLLIFNFTIPDDFNFPGGRIRINRKAVVGPRETDVLVSEVLNPFGGISLLPPEDPYRPEDPYNILPDPDLQIRADVNEVVFYGEPPSWEEDGVTIYDEIVSGSGSFSISASFEYIHGLSYYFRVFSQNILGNFSFLPDSPFLEIEIPKVEDFTEQIAEPNPTLEKINIPVSAIIPGNKKNFIRWNTPQDIRVVQIKSYYRSDRFPQIDEIDIDKSDGTLVFQGDTSENSFVHRGVPNDIDAFYVIVTGDKFGFTSKPVFLRTIPSSEADETEIPLREVRQLAYEIVDEESLTVKWNNPIKIENEIEAWFEQRVILFARVTDEFGRPIIDTSKISIQVEGRFTTNKLADDVFKKNIVRGSSNLSFDNLVSLTQSEINNGVVKATLRLLPGLRTLSEFKEVFATLTLKFIVTDPNNSTKEVFEYSKDGPSVKFKNPWKMGILNQSGDRITIQCIPPGGGNWLDNLIRELDGDQKETSRTFMGTFCRREEKVISRVFVTYRDEPIPKGNQCQVAIFDANGPACESDFKPDFFNTNPDDVLPPSDILEFETGEFLIPQFGGGLSRVSFVDIPITSPRTPKAVILFAKAQFNGFESRRSIYIVYDNILKISLAAHAPESNCSSVSELSSFVSLINPDSPGEITIINDFSIVKWETSNNVPDKEVPFFSTDSVERSGGVFSFTRQGRAKNVFFGPLCDVKQLGISVGLSGPSPIFETHFFNATVSFDGLVASDSKRFEVRPFSSGFQQFGDRFLMEVRGFTEFIWADGFDRAELTIQHEPSTSQSSFSNCFRSCATKDGSFLFPLSGGQIIELSSNAVGSISPIKMTWGDDVEILFDPYLDEELIVGGNSSIDFARVDLSKGKDHTKVYITSNDQVDDPPIKIIGDSSYLSLLKGLSKGEVECSCAPGSNGVDRVQFSTNYFFSGQTFLQFEDSVFILSGGGNWGFGIPPARIELREPLKLRLAYIRNLDTDEIVRNLIIDGRTSHELVYEVSFAGKNIPDNVPVFFDIGGENSNDVGIVTNVSFVENVIDLEIEPDVVSSIVKQTILPINPIRGFFRFLLQASISFDKKNEIDRIKKVCLELVYDERPVSSDAPTPTPPEADKEKLDEEIDELFDKRLLIYDPDLDKWSSAPGMKFPRGALTLSGSIDPYGEKMYAIGGINNTQILSVNEEFDVSSKVWTTVASMNIPRFFHMSATALGFIYIIGGFIFDKNNEEITTTTSVERYDPFSDSWKSLSNIPAGIAMGVTKVVNNKIYVLCGISSLQNNTINQQNDLVDLSDSIYVYDIGDDEWSIIGPIEESNLDLYQRMYPFVFADEDKIYVTDGARQIVTLDPSDKEVVTINFLTDTFVFDTENNTIVNSDSFFERTPISRFRGGSATIADKHYFVGGESLVSQAGDIVEVIDSSISPFGYKTVSDITTGLSSFGMDFDLNGKLYIAGGLTSGRPPGFLTVDAVADEKEVELDGKQSVVVTIKLRDSTGTVPSSVKVVVRGFVLFPCFNEESFEGGRDISSDAGQTSAVDNIDRFALIYPVNFTRNEFFIENGVGTTTLKPRSEDVLKLVSEIKKKLGVEDDNLVGAAGCGTEPGKIIMRDNRDSRPYKIRVQITIVDDFFFGQSVLILEDLLSEADEDLVGISLAGPDTPFADSPPDTNCFEVDGRIVCEDGPPEQPVETVAPEAGQSADKVEQVIPESVQEFSGCRRIGFTLLFPELGGGTIDGGTQALETETPTDEGAGTPFSGGGKIPSTPNPTALPGTPPTDPESQSFNQDSSNTGITVDNLLNLFSQSSTFDIVPTEIPQSNSPTIQYVAKKPWLPTVRKLTESNSATAEDILKALQRLEFSDKIGASPFYDALVESASIMQKSTGDSFKKSIYAFVDNEESLSSFSLDEAILEIQLIDGFKETPVIVNNMSIVFPVTLSALLSRTDTESLDKIAVETSGQSVTVLSEEFVDEILNNSIGRVIGSIGYGRLGYTVDIGVITVINTVSFDADIFINTDGNWKVSISDDGINFSSFSDQFDIKEEVDFVDLNGRFLKFEVILLSGLSSSIEEVYDATLAEGVPTVHSINITHSVPSVSQIFLEPEKTRFSVQQIAVSINATKPFFSSINVGAMAGRSFNFEDYSSPAQPLIGKYGKIFLPIRTPKTQEEIDNSFSGLDLPQEELEFIDGFSWKATVGKWSPDATIIITDSNGIILNTEEYRTYPRDGLIVFPNKKSPESIFFIKIENIAETRLGIEVVNRLAGNTTEIEGVGYMYNSNEFLPAPISERPPVAKNLTVDPKNPFIFDTVNAVFDYFDINRDPEDRGKTLVRWFINGNPQPIFDNFRTFNNIEDFDDPVWKFGYFSFRPTDIPAGKTIEQFAREKAKETKNPEGIFRVGDSLFFEITPHDGKNAGKTVRSASVEMLESSPFATNIEVKGRRTDGVFTDDITTSIFAIASFEFFTDTEDEDDKSQIVWFVNNIEFKRGNVFGSTNGFPNNQISPREINLLGVIGLEIGNSLRVRLIPSSKISEGDILDSDFVTVGNSIPIVQNVSITPENPNFGSNIRVTYTFIDEDVSVGNIGQSDQSTIAWFRKTPEENDFIEIDNLVNSNVVSSSEISPGEIWKAVVTPFDGIDTGVSRESREVGISGIG